MSFFDENYHEPQWLLARKASRRTLLKSAAAGGGLALLPRSSFAAIDMKPLQSDPWLTLNAVLNHLLPPSEVGPSANEIQAINYVYLLVTEQPIDDDEKQFIQNGVGWLNGYTNKQLQAPFIALDFGAKEAALRTIAKSRAGENWLSTLLSYIFEAMLAPSSYGGNPDGIGWQWLEHQAGFPMPEKGKRYFELPGQNITVKTLNGSEQSSSKADS